MDKKKLRVGIAGYGVVGKRRRQFIDKNPFLKTVAVSDVTFENREMMPDGMCHCVKYEELFDHQLDVLFVSLPDYLAAQATIAGLEHNLHVFCEKPPGRTVSDIKEVLAVESAHPQCKLKYGFNHRYHDSVIEAKRIIDTAKYGRIINLRGVYGKSSIIPSKFVVQLYLANDGINSNNGRNVVPSVESGAWRGERKYAGGGILLDQGIHMLDMMRYFCGDFKEVQSFITNDYWKHDVEDNAYALMRTEGGCVAMLHSTATQWRHKFRLEITLEEALLELTGILSSSKSYGEEKLTIVERQDGSIVGSFAERATSYLNDHSWEDEVNEFADHIIHNKEIIHGSSLDALKVMELVYKIYCSDEKWRQTFDISSPD